MANILLRLAAFSIRKTIIFGVILGALYYFLLFESTEPIETQLVAVNTQVAEAEKKQKDSDRAIKEVAKIRAQVEALSDQYRLISTQIPSEVQMADILKQIDSMAATSGINVTGKEPRAVIAKDILEELPLKVTAEGSFSEMVLFLYNLMNSERVSRILSFNISKVSVSGVRPQRKLVMEVLIANYRFVGEPKVAEPPKNGASK